jgi:Leucine-rich repeat (LRR) protein
VTATDADPNDTLIYTLGGLHASSFSIDGASGQLMTRAALDYEVRRSYIVTVRASDGTDTAEIQVTISVTDIYPRCTTQEVGNRGLTNDCEALLESRPVLEGTNGSRLNWSERRPMAQWEGITLRGTPRRVTRLDLMDVGLHGTIPASLSRLSELTHLNLRSNPDLTGEVPGELGNLSKLRLLNLHSNSHSGGVPDLRNATLLEELYLANNADYVTNDDGKKVKIEGTGLTGQVPTWLNGMTNMEELWLWGNSLTGTVPNLSGMTSLDKLKLANNNLTGGIPQASRLPPNMTWLIIDRNPFRGTIPNLSSLSRLRLLWLHSNQLTGPVPAGNNYPASLDDLNLRDNRLTGTIPDLSNLDNLTRLRLHNNSLSGAVPGSLGGLDSLKQLWLHNEEDSELGNNMFTSIDDGVGGLSDTLIEIQLGGNPWADDACVPAALADVATNDYGPDNIEACPADDGS